MLEVIPSGVGGDKHRAQQFAGMIIHSQQQGLLRGGGPPLSVKRAMTPEQKKSNQRLGMILGAVAVAVFVGFILKGAFGGL